MGQALYGSRKRRLQRRRRYQTCSPKSRQSKIERLEQRNLLAAASAPPILQWFESSFDTIEERVPDLFELGYGSLWLPPPGRADSGDQSVGYDVYDRFDLGSPDHGTLYGTETGLKQLSKVLDRASASLHVDAVLNHAGFSDMTTDGFVSSGGYPGLAITLDNAIDGDFHSGFLSGDLEGRLSGLVDVDHSTNHELVRHPVDAADNRNIPSGTITDPFGRLANQPASENSRFYPDRDGPARFLFDPVTNESDIPVYSFNSLDPLSGDAVAENALGYMMRYMQWMVEVVGVDGFRVDAAKHFDGFVMDYLDRAVYRSNPRLLLDGTTENVFSYSEVFDGNRDTLLSYVKKNIDPNDPGRIGGNRDVLDFSAFFAMRDNLSSPGTASAWFNVRDSLLDLHDDGLHNGSAGVLFVRSHDEFGPTSLGNVAHAFSLMYPGNTVIYFNGKEFGDQRDFPKAGRGDSLGGVYGATLEKLVSIRHSHGRGDFYQRLIGNEGLYVFERENSAIVGLSNRGDAGFDERTVQVAFAPGTRLVELTGNASDPSIDPYDDLADFVEVSASQTVTIRIPRNSNADGQWHGSGFVIYGLATPVSASGIELTGVASTLAGGVAESTDYSNGVTRLTDIQVVTGDKIDVNLATQPVYLPGTGQLRDTAADGDAAMLRIDNGVDVNGNGTVDYVTPGEATYGYELFSDLSSPLVGPGGLEGARGSGVFRQEVDLTGLAEGIHFIQARVFRHRPNGGPEVFSDFKETIYVDRLPPNSGVASFRPYVEGINENRNLVVESLDQTANSVHVFLNLSATLTDPEILALVGDSNRARQIDRDQFIYGFNGVPHGNNVATIVSYERTGNVNVQRVPGLFASTIIGGGLGDLDFNGIIELADVAMFEQIIVGNQVDFNPAADFDANGVLNYVDLQLYSESLVTNNAAEAIRTELERVRSLVFAAIDDQYALTEDDLLQVADAGLLSNDLVPEIAADFSLVTTGSLTTNRQRVAAVGPLGGFEYDSRGQYDDLAAGQTLDDYFDYVISDGFGNQSSGRATLTIEGVNDAPRLVGLSDQSINEDSRIQSMDLGVFDPDHSNELLDVTVSVSDPGLFDVDGVSVNLVDGRWELTLVPAADQSGSTFVSIQMTDPGPDGDLATTGDNALGNGSFELTVLPVNDAPVLLIPFNLALEQNAGTQVIAVEQIDAGGGEQQPLRISASVGNPAVISVTPESSLVTGNAAEFLVTPVLGQTGVSQITLTVEDGGLDADLETTEDNATSTGIFEVGVGRSSYDRIADTVLIELRGSNLIAGVSRNENDLVFDLGAEEWFALNRTYIQHAGGNLKIPISDTGRIEAGNQELVDWQFQPADGWEMGTAQVVESQFYRSLVSTDASPAAEIYLDAPTPWQNLLLPSDVDNSGSSTAVDALRVINELVNGSYSDETGLLSDPLSVSVWPNLYFDVNGDDTITALDALTVINQLVSASSEQIIESEWLPNQQTDSTQVAQLGRDRIDSSGKDLVLTGWETSRIPGRLVPGPNHSWWDTSIDSVFSQFSGWNGTFLGFDDGRTIDPGDAFFAEFGPNSLTRSAIELLDFEK